MIVKENLINKIDKKMGEFTKGLKKGFWAGLLAFILAKICHVLISFAIGFTIGSMFGLTKNVIAFCKIIDSPIVGLLFLVFATRFIYIKIVK